MTVRESWQRNVGRMTLSLLVLALPVSVQGLSLHGKHNTIAEQNHENQVKSALTQNNWTAQDFHCPKENYYPVSANLCCLKCPAGAYVAENCNTPYTRGKCQPCTDGEDYTEWPNGLDSCLACHSCREDQEVVSHCTAQNNTVCQCKAGRFCSPEQSCEICRKCKASCPEDQTVKAECTPTSDTVCEAKQSSAGTLSRRTIALIVIVLVLIFVFVCLVVWCKKTEFGKTAGCFQTTRCKIPWRNKYTIVSSVLNMLMPKMDNGGHQEKGTRQDRDRTMQDVVTESSFHTASANPKNWHGQRMRDSDYEFAPTGDIPVDVRSLGTISGGGRASEMAGLGKTDSNCNQDWNERMSLLPSCSTTSTESHAESLLQSPTGMTSGSLTDPLMGIIQPEQRMKIFRSNHTGAKDNDKRDAANSESSLLNSFSTLHLEQSPDKYKESPHPFQLAEELSKSKGLLQYFPCFLDHVPIRRWKEFMRKLQLTENEIVEAERNNVNDIREGHYQMLRTWFQKEGNKASITFLLQTLYDMELVKATNDVYQSILNDGTKEH
ncbi:uncharacterized protein LOC125448146 isoform X2 [Stegostoma tigrinum]|uniref:uncharacterized protein LOC125448146 isoform X2 n=1 Tax=Stegostoma tigrinum TaxID=3053191 RepID=UPI00287048A1|nr:uncharacterized protein LOC125448146 isoform X2 [Stegostoma tigrinum]